MQTTTDEHPRTPTVEANITVHTRMADEYNNEPHFLPENRAKVRGVLEGLAKRVGPDKRLLDVGCGTGFVIGLSHDLFASVDGLDITPAMLAKIDTSPGNITLHTGIVENLPFENATFDMVSSYSFLHHVADHHVVLKEVRRVLKPGGLFYIDLEPNKLFWQHMLELEKAGGTYSDIVTKEINSVLHTDDMVESQFGIPSQMFRDAEPIKSVMGGFDPFAFRKDAIAAGFMDVELSFEWYLGQGAVLHGQSKDAAETVGAYLQRTLPLTAHLYKYLRFVCIA
ncbi:MAG: hypothetical protein NVS2B17_31640 [Candidatus Velthaea sp.]